MAAVLVRQRALADAAKCISQAASAATSHQPDLLCAEGSLAEVHIFCFAVQYLPLDLPPAAKFSASAGLHKHAFCSLAPAVAQQILSDRHCRALQKAGVKD